MNPLRSLEQTVLAEGREWTRARLEERLQKESEALPAVCPQSGEPLCNTRWRDLELETVAGTVRLRVRHGYSEALQAWVCPARPAWGLPAYGRMSPELEARLVYTATEVGSYERGARMAQHWGSPVSDNCIHQHVQRLGSLAQDLQLPMPKPPPKEPEFSLVLMMDGWMARERGPDWGAGPRKKDPRRVAWHEIKSAVIYRLEQRVETSTGRGLLLEKHIVATPPETAPVDFGSCVQAEAMRRGLGRAKVVYVVMDGALWLWELVQDRFAEARKTLDFHHAREHLQAVAEALHGAGTPEAHTWLDGLVHSLRHGKEVRVVRVVDQLGWPVVAVLKQERYEIHQEALALSAGKKPGQVVERNGRQVEIWDVPALRLSESYTDPVRVVRVREQWTQRQRVGGEWRKVEKEQNWIWVVAGDLDACDGATLRDIGHFRWKIENNAFGELTQHWHLTHCAHHQPAAVVALLWIKIIAFTLFHAFAILHGKLFRLGKATLQELRKQIYRSLLCGSSIRFFSG